MKNEEHIQSVLKNVDARRRGFLTKILAGGVALPAMSTIALGQPPQGGGKGKGGKGKGGKGKGGAGKGAPGEGGQGGMMGDPSRLAALLIEAFDKDGDKALNVRELTAALTEMRDRRGGAGKGKGKGAPGEGGAGKGKGKGAGNAENNGGVKPKRPDVE